MIYDLVIAVAYFSIPMQLIYFVMHWKPKSVLLEAIPGFAESGTWFSYRKSIVSIMILFALFILFCGLNHGLLALWPSAMTLIAYVKLLTALVSVLTAAVIQNSMTKFIAWWENVELTQRGNVKMLIMDAVDLRNSNKKHSGNIDSETRVLGRLSGVVDSSSRDSLPGTLGATVSRSVTKQDTFPNDNFIGRNKPNTSLRGVTKRSALSNALNRLDEGIPSNSKIDQIIDHLEEGIPFSMMSQTSQNNTSQSSNSTTDTRSHALDMKFKCMYLIALEFDRRFEYWLENRPVRFPPPSLIRRRRPRVQRCSRDDTNQPPCVLSVSSRGLLMYSSIFICLNDLNLPVSLIKEICMYSGIFCYDEQGGNQGRSELNLSPLPGDWAN